MLESNPGLPKPVFTEAESTPGFPNVRSSECPSGERVANGRYDMHCVVYYVVESKYGPAKNAKRFQNVMGVRI